MPFRLSIWIVGFIKIARDNVRAMRKFVRYALSEKVLRNKRWENETCMRYGMMCETPHV
jgi:hypothetical protein